MSKPDLLSVRDLEVDFRIHGSVVRAVRGVSFGIGPGSTVALVGESGSGKSVIAQSILRILPNTARITAGQILFADVRRNGEIVDIARLPTNGEALRAIRGGRISMIFQEPMVSLSPLHTVGDQVSEALFLHREMERRQGLEITEDMLRLVGFPDPRRAMKTYPFELSGGLRQRAMIAMALVCHPALLIADEPTTALDVTIQAQILSLIRDVQAELGMSVLIITHDLGVVANVAEEVVVVYHGEVMERGSARDIFEWPGHPYLRALLEAVPHFDMKPGERLRPIREIEFQTGPLLQDKRPWPPDAEAAGPHLSVRNLRKTFQIRKGGGWVSTGKEHLITAVNEVSFDIHRGECLGLVGESGCGKTTVGKIIMRALRPDSGSVTYNDRGTLTDILALEGESELVARQKIQLIFQDPFSSLNPRMTVFDIMREPLIIHKIGDQAYHEEMAKELLRLVGLDPRFLNRYPHSFSGGQRQRIGIARALALRPDLLICDEPVSALDVSIQAQIMNLLKELQQELRLTYLFISHNLAVVDYVSDRIAVMCQGRLVEVAPRGLLFRDPIHPYTKALVSAVPYADLDRRLDMSALMEGKASDPAAWAPPFRVSAQADTQLIQVDTNHTVRAMVGTVADSLRA
ncbi:MAG: ABC transporter ATP-binding protein [Gammaproteobacteria bacterium]|nr:ABC transporter ATP-binding protein [Gammaproteobacteria bacterium]